MKIYTYYEDRFVQDQNLRFRKQEDLIQLWKSSWEEMGFEPIVLDQSHSSSHPYYDEFTDKMSYLHREITGDKIFSYGFSCYYRWMAYAQLKNEESFYVSDYDVINKSFKPKEYNERCFLNGTCPCLAFGNSSDFNELTYLFISLTEDRLKEIKDSIDKKWYHDQNFLICNKEEVDKKFKIYNPQELWRERALIHLSFHRTKMAFNNSVIKNEYGEFTMNEFFKNTSVSDPMLHLQDVRINILNKFLDK